jgi:hypothetical protein
VEGDEDASTLSVVRTLSSVEQSNVAFVRARSSIDAHDLAEDGVATSFRECNER